MSKIIRQEISERMADAYHLYAMAVIEDRALPDILDGLKNVQRRILYTMYDEGNTSSKNTRKCAKTVGSVLGRFHAHGK